MQHSRAVQSGETNVNKNYLLCDRHRGALTTLVPPSEVHYRSGKNNPETQGGPAVIRCVAISLMTAPASLPNPATPTVPTKESKFFRNTILAALVTCVVLIFVEGHEPPQEKQNVGYWGPPSATIDWCEANYTHSYYIAEFYNTLSNLGYLVLTALGIILNSGLEKRYLLAYASIGVIGIGSAMFHGTLLFSAQLCDELPMFYLFCVVYYCCKEHPSKEKQYPLLPWLLLSGVTAFSVVYYHYPSPILFQVGWGLFVTYTFWLSSKFITKIPYDDRSIGKTCIYVMVVSVALWLIDQLWCTPFIRLFRLHAAWHCGTALAAYLMVTSLWYYRAKYVLHQKVVFRRFVGLPYVSQKSSFHTK